MISYVLGEAGLQVDRDDKTHPPVPGVPNKWLATVCIPSANYRCISKDVRVTNTLSYPVRLKWRIEGDVVTLWVEKELPVTTTQIPSEEPLPERFNWGLVALVCLLPLIVLALLSWLAPGTVGEGMLWVTDNAPVLRRAISEALKEAMSWWFFIIVGAVIASEPLRILIRYGFGVWVRQDTTLHNWQIAVVALAFLGNLILRRYFYAKRIREVGGYFVVEKPPKRRFKHWLFVLAATAFIVITAMWLSRGVQGLEPSIPPVSTPAPTDCSLSEKVPQAVRRWCSLIEQYSTQNGLDPALVAAVIKVESNGNPKARSRCDATGLMQIMPRDLTPKTLLCGAIGRTGHVFRGRPTIKQLLDPEINVKTGTRILGAHYERYSSYREALKRYGPATNDYSYADKVLSVYEQYKNR
ncbi:hypothetical protein A2783_00150 [Microgenomates group bacterium RIFCSPHIGHO2_01_FULL_45_11]|nr:MAG: hypothetical protein A2783_00150 [Microgenomates group bacterium RIFCSPHIGHO2_01_FULL_45_11]